METGMDSFEHIAEATTRDSAGGQVLDLLILKDGRMLVISEDATVLYQSMDDLEVGEARERAYHLPLT